MDQNNGYIQIAYNIFKERLAVLLKTAPQSEIQKLEQCNFQDKLNLLLQLENQEIEVQKFASILFISASKCFETYAKNENGEDRFPFVKYSHEQIYDEALFLSTLIIDYFLKKTIQFKPFTHYNILQKAHECVKKNIAIVRQILNQDISMDQLEQFLKDQEVVVFFQGEDGVEVVVQGLSSMDGKKVYLSNHMIQKYNPTRNYKQEDVDLNTSIDSNHGEYLFNHFRKIQWTIEHHMMENITKYFSQLIDHRSISPERNPNLRVYNHMVGSGRFFEKKVHNRKFNQPNPLKMNILRNYQNGFY